MASGFLLLLEIAVNFLLIGPTPGLLIMDIQKDNQMYMQIALLTSQRSYAKRLKVGCVIVKNHSIISFGWNGMPTGYDNCCEMEVNGQLVTRPEVQHAELNAIAKLAENGYSSKGAAIFITHSPCIHCALLIQKCGITEVYYHTLYRSSEGLEFLKRAGIRVTQLTDIDFPTTVTPDQCDDPQCDGHCC